MIDVQAEVTVIRSKRDESGNIDCPAFHEFLCNFRKYVFWEVDKLNYGRTPHEVFPVFFGKDSFPYPATDGRNSLPTITDVEIVGSELVVSVAFKERRYNTNDIAEKLSDELKAKHGFSLSETARKGEIANMLFEEKWNLPISLIENMFNEIEWDKLSEFPGDDYIPNRLGSPLFTQALRSMPMMTIGHPRDFPHFHPSMYMEREAHAGAYRIFLIPQDDGSFELDARPIPAEEVNERQMLIASRSQYKKFSFTASKVLREWFEERMEVIYMTMPTIVKSLQRTDREKARQAAIAALQTTVRGARFTLVFDGRGGEIRRNKDGAKAVWKKKLPIFDKLTDGKKHNIDEYADALPDTAFSVVET